jgi:hypothetical protein
MRDRIGAVVFYILSLLLFPVTLLGYVIWTGSLFARRRSGVSATAQGPLSARWFAHNLARQDEPAIAAAQRVEHYENAGYGCVCTYAHQLGDHDNCAALTSNEHSAREGCLGSDKRDYAKPVTTNCNTKKRCST